VSQSYNKNTLSKYGFSIEYPSHLELDESGKDGTLYVLKTQKDGVDDMFVENINLTVEEKNLEFIEFIKRQEQKVKSIAILTEKKEFKLNELDCFRLVFYLTVQDVDLVIIQHFFVLGDKIYALTFTSEEPSFKHYFYEMNEILMSIRLD
jgi:hypothetical protein